MHSKEEATQQVTSEKRVNFGFLSRKKVITPPAVLLSGLSSLTERSQGGIKKEGAFYQVSTLLDYKLIQLTEIRLCLGTGRI